MRTQNQRLLYGFWITDRKKVYEEAQIIERYD
jgi:hypothetical protein